MEVGDVVVFRKLVKGHWQGTDTRLFVIKENNLKFGEVNVLVADPKTNEEIYTNTSILVKAENVELPPQHLNLLTGEWEY